MTLRSTILPLLLLGAACSQQPDTAPPEEPQPTPAAAAPEQVADESPTTGGDGSAIVLNPLTAADIRASDNLTGELGCSFTRTAGGPPLLVAMANVGSDVPGTGVIKVGDYVEFVGATGGPGFGAMADEGSFAAKGLTIKIEETGEPPAAGHESPPYPARMTLDRADGARRTLAGFWTCGP